MIFLRNDYSEGIQKDILQAIIDTNNEQQIGYGEDEHTANAAKLICERIKKPNADVHLLVGGTQVNKIAMCAFMRPYEAVISTNLAHIAVHETGAIEQGGHKIIEMSSKDGFMTVKMIENALAMHLDEHMVMPKVVYISNATELGTVYTKSQLLAISECCKKHNLYLYIDGARLSNALTCEKNDITIEEIADLCDAFYIGGTKNGMAIGEALVILNDDLKSHFRFYMKQHGALLAKGRFLGVQFERFMQDDLFLEIAKHTNRMAKLLSTGLEKLGFEFVAQPDSNLIFIVLPNEMHEKLQKYCHYEAEVIHDEFSIEARFVTSFATPESDIEKFLKVLSDIKNNLI